MGEELTSITTTEYSEETSQILLLLPRNPPSSDAGETCSGGYLMIEASEISS